MSDFFSAGDETNEPGNMRQLIVNAAAVIEHEGDMLAGRGLVDWDDENRCFLLYNGIERDGYHFSADDLKTAADLVKWIYHLREKNWFTHQHLSDLLDLVQEKLGDPRNWGIVGWAQVPTAVN